MKQPPANASPEARLLREAAVRYAENANAEPIDDADSVGQKLNRELLFTAWDYAYRAAKVMNKEKRRKGKIG